MWVPYTISRKAAAYFRRCPLPQLPSWQGVNARCWPVTAPSKNSSSFLTSITHSLNPHMGSSKLWKCLGKYIFQLVRK